MPTFTSLESWNWRLRNSLLVQKKAKEQHCFNAWDHSRSYAFFLSLFFLVIFFQSFYIVCFFSTTLDKLWYDHFFFFYFPTRFIFFFILIPAEVTIEAHMFSGPFVLRCFTTETSYKLRETSKEIFLASFWFFFEKNITNFARRIVVSDSERSKILQVKIQIIHSENVSVRSKEGRGCRAN